MMPRGEKITAYHWLLFAICFLGTAFAGTISTLMSVYLPVAVKDLLGNKNEDELNRISAYINSPARQAILCHQRQTKSRGRIPAF
jgi:hypothetical protein